MIKYTVCLQEGCTHQKRVKLKGGGERGHLPLVVSSQLAPYLQNNPIELVVLYMHTQQVRSKVRILTPRMLVPTNTKLKITRNQDEFRGGGGGPLPLLHELLHTPTPYILETLNLPPLATFSVCSPGNVSDSSAPLPGCLKS